MYFQSDKDPFRSGDWRWKKARWLRESGKYCNSKQDDPAVKVIKSYQVMKAKCKTETATFNLATKYPGIYWAEQLYTRNDHIARWIVEAFLLANDDPIKLADRIDCSVDTIIWYEKAFFNVLPHLQKKAYIIGNVMGKSVNEGLRDRDFDLLWKLVGYACGPVMLDAFISAVNGVRVTEFDQVEPVQGDLVKSILLKKSVVAALTMPIAYNQVNVIDLYARLKELEKASGNTNDAHSSIVNNIHAALTSMTFTTETKLASVPELDYYDSQGVELRANEMIAVAMGKDDPSLREAVTLKIPMEAKDGHKADN